MSNLSYLSNYQPFTDKHELNEAIADHLSRNKYELNETDRDIIVMLSRYAVKYPGAAHLKVATIARTVNKSQITVRRVLNKLAKLRIIKKQPFFRKVSGGTGANVYIILPSNDKAEVIGRDISDKFTQATDKEDLSGNEPITNLKRTKSVITNTYDYDNMTLKSPYKRFKNAVSTFMGEGNQPLVSRLYGVYLGQTKALRKAYKNEDEQELIDVAIQAIHATMQTSKTKQLRNIAGYFNGVLSNMLDRMAGDVMAELWADC